uniref:Uncharacterized protein n=1 Tax=Opuntia streptacantha TaxID=393608 RepID=A0A7C8YHM2_OPUST
MNYCAIQCNGVAVREEMRSFVAIGERRESVVCPKPRRVGLLNTSFNDPSRSLRWQLGHQAELDARAGSELLDIILSKFLLLPMRKHVLQSLKMPMWAMKTFLLPTWIRHRLEMIFIWQPLGSQFKKISRKLKICAPFPVETMCCI